jgi:hypothetical protein
MQILPKGHSTSIWISPQQNNKVDGQGEGGGLERHKGKNSINVFISGHKRAVQKHGILLGPPKYAPDFDWVGMDNGMKCKTKQLPNLISYILPYHM